MFPSSYIQVAVMDHVHVYSALQCVHCSLFRPTGHVQVSHFTIDSKYPPFVFSRVKSFSTNCRGML